MLNLSPKYLFDDKNKKVAVQLDIKTFEKIERLLEDYGLVKKMQENDRGEDMTIQEAEVYYKTLKKAD